MGRHYIFIIGLAALVTFSISCVSSKKYKSLQETSRQYMNERDDFRTDKENLEMKNRELDAKISSLNKEKES